VVGPENSVVIEKTDWVSQMRDINEITREAMAESFYRSITQPNPLFEAVKAGHFPKPTRLQRWRNRAVMWRNRVTDAWGVLTGKYTVGDDY
jgi:hypothetical protein